MSLIKSIMTISIILMLSVNLAYAKNAIIVGASSGMGREVAKLLSKEGYTLGLAARRLPWLESLQQELPGPSYIKQIDVKHPDARQQLAELIEEMGGIDLIIISISSYLDNRNDASSNENDIDWRPANEWTAKERILDIDLKGFIAMADVALQFFIKQNRGHLVGVSSTSGLRGNASSPEYSGAKACISTYMVGVRNAMIRDNIDVSVTDIVPGFVAVEHSPFGEDPNAYWEITVQEAGKTILEGIKRKKKVVYVPPKVWVLAFVLKYLPDCLYQRYLNWM